MKALMVAALAISSSVAFAQTSAPSNNTAASVAPTEVKAPKPICRTEATTGSRFTTRTCHSKEDWTTIDAANAAIIERSRNPQSK
jgi:hypothetical protein